MPMYLQASKQRPCERTGMQHCTRHPCPSAGHGTSSAHCNMNPHSCRNTSGTSTPHCHMHGQLRSQGLPLLHDGIKHSTHLPHQGLTRPLHTPAASGPQPAWHVQPSEAPTRDLLRSEPHATASSQPLLQTGLSRASTTTFAWPNCSVAVLQSSTLLQASPPLNSPAANHHGLVGHLFGLLHVGHQLVSILHIAQVVDASQVGVLGAKLVQGRVLQAGGGAGAQEGNSSGLHGAGSHQARSRGAAHSMQAVSRQQPSKAACISWDFYTRDCRPSRWSATADVSRQVNNAGTKPQAAPVLPGLWAGRDQEQAACRRLSDAHAAGC